MITLIHGSDIRKSRLKLREMLADSSDEKIYLDGKKVGMQEVIMACETASLFTSQRTIVLENFFQRKVSPDAKKNKKIPSRNGYFL